MLPFFDRFSQFALVALERQHVISTAFDNLLGNGLLAAHGVDGDDAALQFQHLQHFWDGRDLVGFRLRRLASASTSPLVVLQALTMCAGPRPFLRQCERRRLLPSMAMISSPHASRTDSTHSRKQASKTSGDSSENTRPRVSWEGIPCGNSRNRRD